MTAHCEVCTRQVTATPTDGRWQFDCVCGQSWAWSNGA